MKRNTLLLLCALIFLAAQSQPQADGTTIQFDLNKWGSTLSQKVAYTKGTPFLLAYKNADANAFKSILENSTMEGQLEKKPVNKKLSELDTTSNNFDLAKKSATINFARTLTHADDKDSIVLTIKKDDKDTGKKITVKMLSSESPKDNRVTNSSGSSVPQTIAIVPYPALEDYKKRNYPNLVKSDVGFKKPGDFYTIHIFLDAFGNPLFGSVPSGIQNKYHYMVHILSSTSNQSNVVYYFDNISGGLSDAPVIANADQTINNQQASVEEIRDTAKKAPEVTEMTFNFFPTSDELKFDVGALIVDSDTKQRTTLKLTSYSIRKTSFYSSSLNIGGVYSWLPNPTYELVNSPVNQGKQTVKVTDKTTGGMVTILYTVYWSPVNALFKGRGDVKYSSWGRTYLDDNSISVFRKIYPAIGFGLKDQVFTNIIAGLNCQPVRELGIFAGANIGKKNTFDMPGFEEGKTDVTQDEFNYYQNKKWKASWAVGIVIDISVFNKVLGNLSTGNAH
jgi:hypothetical protein